MRSDRALVCVLAVDGESICVSIPSWDPHAVIRLPRVILPESGAMPHYFFASVNLAAESVADLNMTGFESAPEPGPLEVEDPGA